MVELTIRRERRQTRYFVETLPEEVGLDMVLVPSGAFLMGSPKDELEREEREGPQREVTLPAFFMGRYPVTQAQWQAVVGLPQVEKDLESEPSYFKGDNRPVEQVFWYDAVEFCARLAAYTKRKYRLPSEAEWEYACRSGTTTPFYFGHTLMTNLANYNGNYTYGDGPEGEYRKETTPVDYFDDANAWGLSDMHGNVWEWCQDHWHENYESAPTDGSAWTTGGDDSYRVLRGGSWTYGPRNCRSASRRSYRPDDLIDFKIGFRVVCSVPRALQ